MSIRFLPLFILANVLLLMATTSIAQFVIDTRGEPVEDDEEYFIAPATSGNGGRTTLVTRNGPCPLHVGLENTDLGPGVTLKFIPFDAHNDDDDLRLNKDLKIVFEAASSCAQSTEWRLGEGDTTSGRRLIITGRDDSTSGSYGNFFRIVKTERTNIYNIQWCPLDVCPTCVFECGTVGVIRENGKILLALDGGALPLVFQKED